MFNLQGSELIIILLLALVVLGPEKLPDAMRKLGSFYAQMKKMSTTFQEEFKAAVDEPMREVRETANMLRDSADFRKLSTGERTEKPKSADMASTPAAEAAAADATQAAGAASQAGPESTTPPDGAATPSARRDPFGGVSSASPRVRDGDGGAGEPPIDIPSPKPPAGPVTTGAPPVPSVSSPPPPPPPPPPNGSPALAPSEVEAE